VSPGQPGPPLWLLLELTYRCPLHCVYCSNPTDFARVEEELETEEWLRVIREARALGAVQLGLSGGEPLVRRDLEAIVAEARALGYYTNLITSGVGLNEARIAALKAAGLDHIQLSFQDSTRELNDFLASTRTFDLKAKAAALIKRYPDHFEPADPITLALAEEVLGTTVKMGAATPEARSRLRAAWDRLRGV